MRSFWEQNHMFQWPLNSDYYEIEIKNSSPNFCDGLQSHTQSENSVPNTSINQLLWPQLSDKLLNREKEFKRTYWSTYQRCRQITSKTHEHRNRFELRRPISIGQNVFLENRTQDLTKSQKMKQLRVGPFTVTKQNRNRMYEIRDDNPDNVKTTHRNNLIEHFPKKNQLPPPITNYAVTSRDSEFYKHLVNSQV